MGCKPSKQSQVATGNMVSSGNLQNKQPNVSTKEETEETVSNLIPHKAEENGNLLENVRVKEAQLVDASEEEGKHIAVAVDSPEPSKQSQVATGNMVSSGNLQNKQPNVSTKEETEETVSNLIPHKAEENGNLLENVRVKEAQLGDASEEEGKHITVDSPDRYFSPTKNEEISEGVAASFEDLSETKGSEIEEVEAVAMVEGEVVEMEKDVPEGEDGDKMKEGDEMKEGGAKGETSSKDSSDVKETILVEEKGPEAKIAE